MFFYNFSLRFVPISDILIIDLGLGEKGVITVLLFTSAIDVEVRQT